MPTTAQTSAQPATFGAVPCGGEFAITNMATGEIVAYFFMDRQAASDDAEVRTNRAASEAYLAEYATKFDAALASVATMRTDEIHDTGDGSLVVNHVEYGHADLEAVLAHTAPAERVTLTEDGRNAIRTEWHQGPADENDWVRYEVWTPAGRHAHGFVHRTSRRLLQVG